MENKLNNENQKVERKAPTLIAVHSYNGKRMNPDEKKKFIDGALTTADTASNSFEESIIAEDEWI
jgi:hypothetical protein